MIVELRNRNDSVYEISETLKERGQPLSATAVREVLKVEGFAPLPRRGDEERTQRPRVTVEPVADHRLHVRAGTVSDPLRRSVPLFLQLLELPEMHSASREPAWLEGDSTAVGLGSTSTYAPCNRKRSVSTAGPQNAWLCRCAGSCDLPDLIHMPATVDIDEQEVRLRFHRRAHLPIVLASGLRDRPVVAPW